ncbi:hypothetical protein [Saliphagus sp. LR7]|uniref:hypothetical protein n=1 Tax=Saliphagus sp. LR7 TaxID=2282654 RepID=UPI000DF7784C|nr:hypothetical protein [Saliphagus sp. LR7]
MRKCNRCEQPTTTRLCRECRLEDRHGVPSDHYEHEPDHSPGPYGVPQSAADYLSKHVPRTPWRPDAEFRLMIAGLRGEFPDEWMLDTSTEGQFSTGREVATDGGERMERVTVRFPDDQLEEIDDLVETDDYASRSAVVRDGIQTLVGNGSDDDREIRTDGAGWSPQMVTPDGTEIEPSDKFAGTRPDPVPKGITSPSQRGQVYPPLREYLVDCDEPKTSREIGEEIGPHRKSLQRWLNKLEDQGYLETECRDDGLPGQDPKHYATADHVDSVNDLPEPVEIGAPTQENVLEALESMHADGRAWIKSGDIADRIGCDTHPVSNVMGALRARGLVERWAPRKDGHGGGASWRLVEDDRGETA